MEFLSVALKAVFVVFSGLSTPASVILFCIWASVRNGSTIGKHLFIGHFVAFFCISILAILSKSIVTNLLWLQCILHIMSFVLFILVSLNIASNLVRNIKLISPLKWQRQTNEDDLYDDGFYQYENLYSISEDKIKNTDLVRHKGSVSAFIMGFLFCITNVSWLTFCNVSLAGMIKQSYILCGRSVTGLLGLLLFATVFILSEFIFYSIISNFFSFLGRFFKMYFFNICTLVMLSCFLVFALMSFIQALDTLKVFVC